MRASQYGRDVTDLGRTWSERLRTEHDRRRSCWQRVEIVTVATNTRETFVPGTVLIPIYVYQVLMLPTTNMSSTRQGKL